MIVPTTSETSTERSVQELARLEAELDAGTDARAEARRGDVRIAVVVLVVAGLIAGLLFAFLPRVYSSETKVLIEPAAGDTTTTTANSGIVASQMDTWAALAATADVLQPALTAVGDRRLASDVPDAVRVSVQTGTTIITIDTNETQPQRAAALAYQIGTILIQRVEASSTVPATETTPAVARVSARVVAPAVVPSAPSSPNPVLLFGGALVTAIAVAYLAISTRRAVRRRNRDAV